MQITIPFGEYLANYPGNGGVCFDEFEPRMFGDMIPVSSILLAECLGTDKNEKQD
jgi:hypothetical protein